MGFILKTINFLFVITFIDYVLGFIKTLLTANIFGVTAQTDAYFLVSTSLLFIGTVSASFIKTAFIPIFMEAKNSAGEKPAWQFAFSFFIVCITISAVLVLFCIIFSRPIIAILVPGFAKSTQDLTVQCLRLLAPLIIMMISAAFATSILNSYFKFILPAVSYLIGQAAFVAILVVAGNRFGIHGLILAAIIQFSLIAIIQLFFTDRLKRSSEGLCDFSLKIKLQDSYLRKAGSIFSFLLLILLFNQLLKFVEYYLVSKTTEGALSILSYARVIADTPGRIFTAVVATVFFSVSSNYHVSDDRESVILAMKKQTRFAILVLVPVFLLFTLQSERIISILFAHGSFKAASVPDTATALAIYSLGLFAYSLGIVIFNVYFAIQRSGDIVKITIIGVFITAILDIFLVKYFSYFGIALGFVLGAILTTAFLLFDLKNKLKISINYASPFFIKTAIAAFFTFIFAIFISAIRINTFHIAGLNELTGLAIFFLLMLTFYSAILMILKVEEALRGLSFLKKLNQMRFF